MASVDELCFAPARRLLSLLRAREVSAEELVSAFFERIESHNHKFNAIVTLVEERALEEAAEADRRLATRGEGRPLEGLPITIKDHVATAGVRSTDGMKILEHHVPDRDAPTVERLRAAGAIIIAKTNLPEMAMDYDCDNPVFGATRNPWNLDRVPGGIERRRGRGAGRRLEPAGVGHRYRRLDSRAVAFLRNGRAQARLGHDPAQRIGEPASSVRPNVTAGRRDGRDRSDGPLRR